LTFTFLNKTKSFKDEIDWDFRGYGLLWCYNLNYFDYLNQRELSWNDGLLLIQDFLGKFDKINIAHEPYPTSLRIINWIKFLTRMHDSIACQQTLISRVDNFLYIQTQILLDNLEYHLLANHLLENAFALLFSAYYFKDNEIYHKAQGLLFTELNEQILENGAHFELSPMYHAIILVRILDCINLIKNNAIFQDDLLSLLSIKAKKMLQWLENICHPDGEISFFNDTALGIALNPKILIQYSQQLGIPTHSVKYCAENYTKKGYIRLVKGDAVLILDAAEVGPDYQPGHAHADTLSFEFSLGKQRVIVNSGTSSYEDIPLRWWQRSTAAHSTVEVNGRNSSEVWSSFRVGRRARPFNLTFEETKENVTFSACHDGYRKQGVLHCRKWVLSNNSLSIQDKLIGQFKRAVARYYLHPEIKIISDNIGLTDFAVLKLLDGRNISVYSKNCKFLIKNSQYYPQFGLEIPNKCLEILFFMDCIEINFAWEV